MMTLAQYLEAHNLTQAAFAARVGVEQPTISRLVKNAKGPSPGLAKRIEMATDGKVPVYVWPSFRVLIEASPDAA